MLILDLFAGTGSSTQAFEDAGHRVVKVELDKRFDADLHANVQDLTVEQLLELCGGVPDFVWASPPCTAFSVASISTHWTGGWRAYEPKTELARTSILLVQHTIDLIRGLGAPYWLMENPRGVLRKMAAVADLPRKTVTYCQYGDERMKPTDLWGSMPATWAPKPMCKNGQPCHVAAPRGAKTGTQGRKGSKERSMVPYGLSQEICNALESVRG